MAKFLHYEQCPKCREKGSDKAGDNLAIYSDGGKHCFSCGFHVYPKFSLPVKQEPLNVKEKAVLPRDFSREVPAEGWKWLLQYGLSYSYWKPFTGFTEEENRLVITFGNPIRFSIGRYLGDDKKQRKWFFYGDGHSYVETLGRGLSKETVLVEDIVSAHKVAQVAQCICLFGTNIHDLAIKELTNNNGPVILWLDADQYQQLPKKIGKLQTFVKWPVKYVHTNKDPKYYSTDEIRKILNDA